MNSTIETTASSVVQTILTSVPSVEPIVPSVSISSSVTENIVPTQTNGNISKNPNSVFFLTDQEFDILKNVGLGIGCFLILIFIISFVTWTCSKIKQKPKNRQTIHELNNVFYY